MKIHFTRPGYAVDNQNAATLNWDRNMDAVPRVGDRVMFGDPESPFRVMAVTWNCDGDPDVWVSLR
jgi:hypothetical protein